MNYARRWNRRAASTKARRKAVKDQIRRGLLAERLEDRMLLAADTTICSCIPDGTAAAATYRSAYFNLAYPTDVNNDGFIAASDALAVINTLNSQGSHRLDTPSGEGETGSRMFVDVNNDTYVSPADALAVINQLNAEGAPPDPLVQYNLQPVNAQGTPITQVQTGGDFYLQLLGKDLRPDLFNNPDKNNDGDPDENLRGVYAAYMDILYENNLAAPAVSEVQTITVTGGGTGSFTLTYPSFDTASKTHVAGGTTATINYDQTSASTRGTTATAIQTALNNLFGAGTVSVAAGNTTTYKVTYTKFLNTNIPEPTSSNGAVAVTESTSTNPADASYANAFTSAITYTSNYGNGKSGADAVDTGGVHRIDDVGAFWSAPTDAVFNFDPVEVLRIHMFAMLPNGVTDPQTVHFTEAFGTTDAIANPAPNGLVRPSHDTLVFGNTGATPSEESCVGDDILAFKPANPPTQPTDLCVFTAGAQITSIPGSLTILNGNIFANSFTAPAVNEDSGADSIDVITGHTGFNNQGSGTIILKPASATLTSGQGTLTQNGNNIVFTPAANFNGQAVISYKAQVQGSSSSSDEAAASVTIPVTAINDKPVITAPATVSMQENTALSFTGANAISVTDVDFNESGSTNVGQLDLTVAQGTLTVPAGIAGVTNNNTSHVTVSSSLSDIQAALAGLVYTATDNPNASVSLQISVNDNGNVPAPAQTANATVGINITAQNDAPVNKLNGNAIVDGTSIVAIPNQTFVFAAHSNTFTVTDADAGSSQLTTTVSLSGSAVGTLHVNATTGVTITTNDSASVKLQGSQTDISTALASLAFTPPNGSVAAETLTIATSDGGATGSGGTLTTTNTLNIVLDPGVRPFPLDDAFQFNEGTTTVQSLDVLGNDFTASGATTTIVSTSQPSQGSVAIHAGGTSLDYTPPSDSNFFTPSTPITFTYTIHDTVQGSTDRTATVAINFKNIPDNPVAVDDGPYGASFANGVGTTLNVNATDGVLKNDTDVDNNYGVSNYATLTAVLVPGQGTTKGTLTLNPNGSFSYTPTSFDPAHPNDTFKYTVHAVTPDGSADSTTSATVTIHVTAPPVATNDHFNVLEQGNPATSGNVLTGTGSNPASGADTDGEGQTLTAVNLVQISDPNKGSVVLNANGDFQYVPPTGQNFNTTRPPVSDITFTYQAKATDGRLSNVATVSLTVQEVNDPPTATNDTFLAVKQRPGTNVGVDQTIDVLVNDSILPDTAINGDESLTVTGVSATGAPGSFGPTATTAGGSVKVVNGVVKYTSPTTAPADETFYYQISDNSSAGRGGPLTASARVDVHVVDFVPKIVSGTVFVDSNGNGSQDSGEHALSGVSVKLVGCDFTSQAGCDPNTNVIQTVTTDTNGVYRFNGTGGIGLAPPKDGTSFKLVEVQPQFLLNGIDVDGSTNVDTSTHVKIQQDTISNNNQFILAWSVTDLSGDVTNLNFADGGIDVRTPAQGGSLLDANGLKQEYLASSGQNGFIFELDLSGNMLWSMELDPTGTAWAGPTTISAKFTGYDSVTGGPNLLDFTVAGQTVSLGLGYTISGSTARFRVLGVGANGQYIIRVDGSSAGSSLTTQPYDGMFAANNGASGAGGEGEAAPVNPNYAGAADAVFAEKSWA